MTLKVRNSTSALRISWLQIQPMRHGMDTLRSPNTSVSSTKDTMPIAKKALSSPSPLRSGKPLPNWHAFRACKILCLLTNCPVAVCHSTIPLSRLPLLELLCQNKIIPIGWNEFARRPTRQQWSTSATHFHRRCHPHYHPMRQQTTTHPILLLPAW